MNDTPGLARPKKKQTDAQGKPTLTKDTGLNTAKAKKATKKEKPHRTTVNLPYSIYKELRRNWAESGTPIYRQLLEAWELITDHGADYQPADATYNTDELTRTTTVYIPKDALKAMQKIRSKHEASIADQLISSWAQQTGWDG